MTPVCRNLILYTVIQASVSVRKCRASRPSYNPIMNWLRAFIVGSCISLLGLFAPSAFALTLELLATVGSDRARLKLDGAVMELQRERFTDEGLFLTRIERGRVELLVSGQKVSLTPGEVVIVDTQLAANLPMHQIRADNKNRYLTAIQINGGSVQAEIDRNIPGIIIAAADADRLNLPYKDKPSRSFRAPKQTVVEVKDGKEVKTVIEPKDKDGKPLVYRDYRVEVNSIRVGNVDLYGFTATVSEKPGQTTVLGREFLRRASPSWSNRTLTLVRR